MRPLVLALCLLSSSAAAQTATERIYRVAELTSAAASLEITRVETLPELAKLGFRQGQNLVLDERTGDATAMEGLIQEILRGKPDAIFAIGPDAIRIAATATKTVPIVTFGGDPVLAGFAASFSHPGGNVTGIVILSEELDGKRLDLLHEAVPAAHRVAALIFPSLPYRQNIERRLGIVAASRGIELLSFGAAGADDYAAVFAAMDAARADALLITGNPVFNRDAGVLAQLANDRRLPIMCEWAENARSGCLFGYGPDRGELRRRAAHLLARIFQGTAPAELPIETPTRFELAVNLKTARALGISLPPAFLARADEVIE